MAGRHKIDNERQNELETRHLFLRMGMLKRNFQLPFPLDEIGFIEGHPREFCSVRGTLELCLRLGSTSEFAVDRFGNDVYRCRFPHVCLKTPDLLHVTTVEQPRDAVYFKYAPELADAMRAAGLLKAPWCWEFCMSREIRDLLHEVRELLGHSCEFGVVDHLDNLALRLFQMLLIARDSGRAGEVVDVRIQRIASYLRLNCLAEIDLEKLLRQNGLSRRNFYRYWQETFAQSPAAYLRELRLEAGFRLLQTTNLPVWMISQRLHFRNTSYFCRLFKQRYGETPHRYRSRRESDVYLSPPGY